MLTALMQPKRARQFFPCWDDPQLKATFTISVEHDSDYTILSNMPIQEHERIKDYEMRTLFQTTPPISPNNVIIIMYNSDGLSSLYRIHNLMEDTVMWYRWEVMSHMKFARHVVGNVTTYIKNNWNTLEGVSKLHYVIIQDFERRIWQTRGFIFHREADVIYNEKLHPVALKPVIMRSIAHEITYQWFGNLFNPSYQSYWWLDEGFIMFLESHILDEVFPESRMMDLSTIQNQHESRHLHTWSVVNSFMHYTSDTFEISSLPFSHIIGAVTWRMLKSLIFYNPFWIVIKMYLGKYFNNLKTPDNFCNFMQTAIELNSKESYLNVKEMINIWSKQKYCPTLIVTRDYSSGQVIITKEIHDTLDSTPYFIPVTYTTQTDINFNIDLPTIDYCLTESNPKLQIPFEDIDKWIIVNIQQTGYYRVNYDPENWRKIGRYLNRYYTNIYVLNRAQLIDDAFNFAIEKKLKFSIFWELTSYLPQEKDYIAWYPMFKAFEYISNIFAFTNTRDKHPKELKEVLAKVGNLFEDIEEDMYNQSIPTNNDLDKYLKQELAHWACIIDNSLCIKMAENQLRWYLKNPKLNKLLPGWQKWIFCNGLKKANFELWHDLYKMTFINIDEETKFDHKILEFFGCSENFRIILNYLEYVIPSFKYSLSKNEISTLTEEHVYVSTANMFLSTLARHAKNTPVLEKILGNFYCLQKSNVSTNAALNVIINNAYTDEQLDKINKFAKNYIPQSYSNIEKKLATRSSQLVDQRKYFQILFDEFSNTNIITANKSSIIPRQKKPSIIPRPSTKYLTTISPIPQ